jgi:hypothetical protein
MTAPNTVVDTSFTSTALDHVLHVGKDSKIAVTSYIPDVLKVAGYVAPSAVVLPAPIDTTLTDPVAIEQEALRYANELQAARDAAELQNVSNTATNSADVSIDVATVIAKTLTHPVDLTHISHVGNAEFKDYVRIEKVLTVGDTSNTLSSIRHSATDLSIDAIDGTPGHLELNTVGFHVGAGSRVSLTHGGVVGAWDILDVSQYNDINPDTPGIIRSKGIVLGQTESGASTDHAIVKANEGISVVEVDNGSFATYTALNLAALKVWNDAGTSRSQMTCDQSGIMDLSTRLSTTGLDFKDIDNPTVIHTTSLSGRLYTDAVLESLGLRLGGVDVLRVQPTLPDPVHGISVSEKVTVPTFKVMAEVDKYFELSSHPGSGALVLHSVEGHTATLLPSVTSLDVTPARLRLIDVASGSYTEMVGGNDELALSVPQIKLVGGMELTEIGKDLKLSGCEKVILDTCTLDASTTVGTLAVSNNVISLGAKVALTAESVGNLHLGPSPTMSVRADDNLSLQARDVIKLRLNTGSAWNEYGFSSRVDGALLLNGHDIDIIPKDVLSGSSLRTGSVDSNGWWRTDAPIISLRFSHTTNPVTRYPKLSDLTFANSVAQPVSGSSPVITNGFTGYGVDVFYTGPYVLRRVLLPRTQVGQNDQRPTSWRVYGTDGKATSSSVWEELGRAGFQDYIDVYTQTAYDCYRVVVNSISSGETLVNTGLQMLMLPPVQNVVAQHSFTGSHMVAYDDDPKLERGMLMSITRDGTLDSIARGGWKRRGGESAIRIDSALPILKLCTTSKDKKVFGVFDSIVTNQWYSGGVDTRARVNGLGEGALWICDENGPIEAGDLLCSASVPGYAMRQDDDADVVRSYTVAKATMSCNFSPVDVPVQTLTQDTNGNTKWIVDPYTTEKSFETRTLPGGVRCAYIACVYMCS